VIYFTIDKGDNYFGGKKGRRGRVKTRLIL